MKKKKNAVKTSLEAITALASTSVAPHSSIRTIHCFPMNKNHNSTLSKKWTNVYAQQQNFKKTTFTPKSKFCLPSQSDFCFFLSPIQFEFHWSAQHDWLSDFSRLLLVVGDVDPVSSALLDLLCKARCRSKRRRHELPLFFIFFLPPASSSCADAFLIRFFLFNEQTGVNKELLLFVRLPCWIESSSVVNLTMAGSWRTSPSIPESSWSTETPSW